MKVVRVVFLFLHPFSGSLGSSVRIKELAISLSRLGVKALILSPYERDHIMEGDIQVKSIPNVAYRLRFSPLVYRLSRFIYYNKFMVRRLLTKRKFQRFVANNITLGAFDVIKKNEDAVDIIQAEQDIAIMPALKLGEKVGVPVVVDLHNIEAEELVAAGVISRDSREFGVLQRQMAEALSQVDAVIVVSEQMKRYIHSEYGISNNDICVVPPGGRPKIRQVMERPFPPKVIFAGSVSYREHVDLFVESMPIVLNKKDDVKFYITRKGEDLKRIQKMSRRLQVDPEFFWYPDENELYKFMALCHVGVLPSTNDVARKIGTPAKLFVYMSVGLPVVANDIGGWSNIIIQENVGILTKDNPQSFSSAIINLLEDTDQRLSCGRRGLNAIKTKYSWDNSAKILHTLYKRL